MSGLKVVDDNTFTIELSHPVSYFAYKLGYDVFSPLPKAFYKDPKGFGEKPIGNGPYKFDVNWEHKKQIKVRKYDDYQGADKAKNGGVDLQELHHRREPPTRTWAPTSWTSMDQVPPSALDELQDRPRRPRGRPDTRPATDHRLPDVRQGTGQARRSPRSARACRWRSTATPSPRRCSRAPASPGRRLGRPRSSQGYKADACGDVCTFNPAKAKELIKEGGGVPGNKMTIQYNADGGHKEWVEAVCNSIRQATGVDVRR